VKNYNGKILIVDPEIHIRQLLAASFTIIGYKVLLAPNGRDGLTIFNKQQPDLVILELILPKLDGFELCRKIRENSQIPIIILTSLNDLSYRITGFDIGADDFIVKPFSKKELEIRVKTLLRRFNHSIQNLPDNKEKIISINNLIIDMGKRKVLKKNTEVNLTNIEYSILELLVENVNRELSRTLILDNVWGYRPERYGDTRIVDVHISRLRSKIENNPSKPNLIITIRGTGYLLQK
jgi:OmpR family response regulator RpaB